MGSPEKQSAETGSTPEMEDEKEKYLRFGKYTSGCPQWLLDKVAKIDSSKIDEEYIKKIINEIVEEFDPKLHDTSNTEKLKESRLITTDEILKKRQRSCGSLATVIASVLRDLKVPTKLIHGRYTRHNPDMRHAWNEAYIKSIGWTPFDGTRGQDSYKLDEFHVKLLEALDWSELEDKITSEEF